MLRSIRTKLALSYALIILVCLLLAGLGALVLIRQYQRNVALSRHRTTATILVQRAQTLLAARTDLQTATERLQQEARRLEARVLLVMQDGLVVADTGENAPLTGQRIAYPLSQILGSRVSAVVRRRLDGQQYFLIITLLRAPPAAAPAEARALPSYLIVIVPEGDVQPAWQPLVPPLAVAGAISLFISILLAVLLSRSITRPLVAMTTASEEMARGNYQQQISISGQDEVARLAGSFNRMAREVEQSRQAQRDFLANISHDLKTPLTSIKGFSQAMLEGAVHDADGYQRAGQIISDEAERMGQLIERLLDLARLDAGEGIKHRTAIVSRALVERCAQKFAPAALKAGVELGVSTPQDLPALYGDEDYLEQALSNLIDNALKYTPQGGKVEIAAQQMQWKSGRVQGCADIPRSLPGRDGLPDGQWLAISVKDAGSGISPEDLPRIFERFYRGDKSRGQAKGAGLGLAIAKQVIEAHGGKIGVSSQPGRGSCFTIYLPTSSAQASTAAR